MIINRLRYTTLYYYCLYIHIYNTTGINHNMWGNGLLGGVLHSPSAFLCKVLHNCISLWLLNDRSSSWMSAKLWSLYKMCNGWRTNRRQLLLSPSSNGASAAQRPVSHFTPVKTFSPTYKNISALMKAFASLGGNQWLSSDLLRCRLLMPLRKNGSGNCGKVAFHPSKKI